MTSSILSFTRIALACAALVGTGAVCADRAGESAPPRASAAQTAIAPLSWTSTGPLVHPVADERHPIVSVKDPTVVYHEGKWHVFATTADTSGRWAMAYFNFRTWEEAPQAKPFHLDQNPSFAGYNCAPQVFYFRPQGKWYLIFQSPQPRFSTTDNIADPDSWSAPQDFFDGTPKSVVQGWLDYWIVCDDTHAYLFFPDDHGRFYRSRTRIEDFPRGFDEPVVVMQETKAADLFEGSCVYRIKDADRYLCLVECITLIDKGYTELSFYALLLLVCEKAEETKIYVVHTCIRMKAVNDRPWDPMPMIGEEGSE